MPVEKDMSSKKKKQFEFSIIAGELKGRKLVTPDLGVTRPPLTRLRKAIFDFLQPYLADGRYLDLFSGTGSYLFEAVSRGAANATGVEMEPLLAEAINRQALEFGIIDRLRCRREDVFSALPALVRNQQQFDIVMLAPPQYGDLIGRTLAALRDNPVWTDETLIVCQHDSSETRRIDYSAWPVFQQRKYGNTTFTVLTPPPVG